MNWLKRKTPLKRSKIPLKRSRIPLKRGGRLRTVHPSDTNHIKEQIQVALREISIIRDGGCVFRNYPESGACGGYRKDGALILQFDHLNSRSHAISFADHRLGVCACKRHHMYFKKQEPDMYMKIVRKQIGEERSALLDRVQEERRAHRKFTHDWKLDLIALEQHLKSLSHCSAV